MKRLRRALMHPTLGLIAGIGMAGAAFIEIFDVAIEELVGHPIGIEHGIFFAGLLQVLKSVGELAEGIHKVEEVVEAQPANDAPRDLLDDA